jgi:cysteine desulfurase
MRSGTENVPGIAGLGRAAEEIYENLDSHVAAMRELKSYFIKTVCDKLPDVSVNGKTDDDCAPHIISLSIKGVRAEVLLHALEDKDIYVSAGSACSTNRPHVSDTLKSIGLDTELLDSTLRFSMSVFTTKEEIDQAIEALEAVVPMLRRYSRQ